MYGDTAVGRRRVAQLREQGGDIRALAARLVAEAEAVPWQGKAADAVRERIRERAAHCVPPPPSTRRPPTPSPSTSLRSTRSRTRSTYVPDGATPEPDQTDATLLAFDPPPAGHKDWLTVALPGL